MTDVNGKKGPNTEGKDIRRLRTASFGDYSPYKTKCNVKGGKMIDEKICNIGKNYTCVTGTEYANRTGESDCWVGAIQICKDISMYLPSVGEPYDTEDSATLVTYKSLYENRSNYPKLTSGVHRTNTPINDDSARTFNLETGDVSYVLKKRFYPVLCVGN